MKRDEISKQDDGSAQDKESLWQSPESSNIIKFKLCC